MISSGRLAPEIVAVVDAVRGAIDDAQRRIERDRQLKLAITAMAVQTLRQRQLSEASIRTLLDIDADTMRSASGLEQPSVDGVGDWELRAEIEQVWMAVRRQASVWLQDDDVTTSAHVVRRNSIDIGCWPLSVDALDTPGAEFAHQTSGQKIVVYSLQSRKGTPNIVDNALASWDHRGEYAVEFISRAGARSPLDLSAYGVLSSVAIFRRPSERDALMAKAFPRTGVDAGRDADEAFALLIAAVRRMCGPLPPYREVFAALSPNGAAR